MWRHIALKEIQHGLNTHMAPVIAGVFVVSMALPVFWLNGGANIFQTGAADLRAFFRLLPFFLMVFIPALAMRCWAEERRSGSLELLMSYPIQTRDLVLGKFLGAYLLCAVCILGTVSTPILVAGMGSLDFGPVFGGYAAALLLSAACLAVCMFVGAMTRNHITAFVCGFLTLAFFMFVQVPALNFSARFAGIARGLLDTADCGYYLCITALFLWLNVQRLEANL